MKNKLIALSMLVTLACLAFAAISQAQSASQPSVTATNRYLSQPEWYSRVRSGTLASNFSDAETKTLLDASLQTTAAAQLWARTYQIGQASTRTANVSQMLGVLASLREGRTNEAIRKLESMVDSDLNLLSISLSLGDQLPVLRIEPRARDLDVLRDAQAYRLKYAVKSESTNTEAGVQRIFSLLEKK